MPDRILEQRRGILSTIRRAISDHEGWLAAELGGQGLTRGSGLGEPYGTAERPQVFATGYDSGSGTTTVAFVFDASAFDGSDRLT